MCAELVKSVALHLLETPLTGSVAEKLSTGPAAAVPALIGRKG